MFETIFGVTNDGSITTGETLICMIFALVLGILLACTYAVISKKENVSISFFVTLSILPAIVAMVIVLVGSNTARALSIAGVFTLVRFRSAQAEGRDLSLVFLAMAAGLGAGLGYFTLAFVAVAAACVFVYCISRFSQNFFANDVRQLRIMIPEDMDYSDAFDKVFEEFTEAAEQVKVKTSNMGTLFELTYQVKLKKNADEKKFLDALRVRNGNLTISLAKNTKKDSSL